MTFVPIRNIKGKQAESIKQIVGDAVIQDVTGIEGLEMLALETARKLADEQGISLVDALLTQILTETDEMEVNKFLTPLVFEQQAGILEQLQNSETFDPAAQEAVSAPGGLLDQLDSGEIIYEQLIEQSASMPGFEGHCDTNW